MLQVPRKHWTEVKFSPQRATCSRKTLSAFSTLEPAEIAFLFKNSNKNVCVRYVKKNRHLKQKQEQQFGCFHQETSNTARKVPEKPGRTGGPSSVAGITDNRANRDNSSSECAGWGSLSSALCRGWISLTKISESEKCRTWPSVRIILNIHNFIGKIIKGII